MKRIFFIFLLPIIVNAQNKIDGLGPFKIGKTLCSKIPTFADTTAGRLFYAQSTFSNTETWYAGYYQIAGMWIQDLTLEFFHDTLYSIKCTGSDSLDLALTAKYGKGIMTVPPDKMIKCRTGLKIEYTETEEHFYINYPTANKNISAIRIFGQYFDDECKKQYHNSFYITNNKTESRVMAEYYSEQDRNQKKKEQDLNKKLKEF